jgi:hypothetical protein
MYKESPPLSRSRQRRPSGIFAGDRCQKQGPERIATGPCRTDPVGARTGAGAGTGELLGLNPPPDAGSYITRRVSAARP